MGIGLREQKTNVQITAKEQGADLGAGLRPCVTLTAAGALIVIALGAYVTSRASAHQLGSHALVDATVHRFAATLVALLAAWLAYWQWRANVAPLLGWTALALLVMNGCVGWMGGSVVMVHATLGPLAFASFVALAVVTSTGWKEAGEFVEASAAPALRPLAIAAPLLLVLQTVLGATYRHQLTGVLPHVGFAMIVTIAILAETVLVLQHYAQHRALRRAAIWLIWALAAQVALGFTAVTLQVLERGSSLALALVIATASHVVVGSLTLAASVVLGMQIQRHVRRGTGARAVDGSEGSLT